MVMRIWHTALFVLLMSGTISGCAGVGFRYYRFLPDESTEVRIHPLGMKVYNTTGDTFTGEEWEYRFSVVDAAYKKFRDCVDKMAPDDEAVLRQTPIVIFPGRKGNEKDQNLRAYTDLFTVFINTSYFGHWNLYKEWAHVYLFITQKKLFGDPLHQHKIFRTCIYL